MKGVSNYEVVSKTKKIQKVQKKIPKIQKVQKKIPKIQKTSKKNWLQTLIGFGNCRGC